jgi:hypothetical protein
MRFDAPAPGGAVCHLALNGGLDDPGPKWTNIDPTPSVHTDVPLSRNEQRASVHKPVANVALRNVLLPQRCCD